MTEGLEPVPLADEPQSGPLSEHAPPDEEVDLRHPEDLETADEVPPQRKTFGTFSECSRPHC